MKNRPHNTRYKWRFPGKWRLRISIAGDGQGYWYGTVWQLGPLKCLYSTGRRLDQREAHAAVQQWLRVQGYHKHEPLGR